MLESGIEEVVGSEKFVVVPVELLLVVEDEIEPPVELAAKLLSMDVIAVSIEKLSVVLLGLVEEVLVRDSEEESVSKATVNSVLANMDDEISILERDDTLSFFDVDEISVEVIGVLSVDVSNIVEELEVIELLSANFVIVLVVDKVESVLESVKLLSVEDLEEKSVVEVVVLSDIEPSGDNETDVVIESDGEDCSKELLEMED
jgi:hypothetical protein